MANKTAKLIKETKSKTGMGFTAVQRLYKLSTPLEGNKYVLVSATNTSDHGNETYIFGADKEGVVSNWGDLPGSFVGELNHEKALSKAGYSVKE